MKPVLVILIAALSVAALFGVITYGLYGHDTERKPPVTVEGNDIPRDAIPQSEQPDPAKRRPSGLEMDPETRAVYEPDGATTTTESDAPVAKRVPAPTEGH